MFGSRRKKVTGRAIEMARQPLAILQHNYGLPPHFWTDDFVLGYFGATIGTLSHLLGEGKLNHEDKGRIMVDVFSELSNMNGKELTERSIQVAQSEPKSDAFELGADNGSIVAFAAFGKVASIGQDAVAKAQKTANEAGEPERMLGILMISMFFEPISKRFNLK
jgi:hypothetical protein